MKKVLIFSLPIIISLQCIGMHTKEFDFNEICLEIEWFVKKAKTEAVQEGKYDVYLARIYGDGKNGYCVTMGIISDSLHIDEVNDFKYFIKLGGELVLLNYSDEFKSQHKVEDERIERIIDKKIITDKIYPGVAFLGTTPGYVCCYNSSDDIVKMYYSNSDNMPYDKKIFNYIPLGETIKLDSGYVNKIFKKKKRK